ncbi:hypothetical protein [Microbacterium sp. VKM Ac-2923]|uniref:hypothetical protein n=1 Tax=Microbacterium sp. VKM Ac-2923 TaxID=2929476 RepID=UPI001FB30761|nr:hypothetical protein [Microbacterium sp. VKM Ac-2923]MCJ1706811.1 hypothetical protein [Microbacterium sp. VKM Ac-2923]
MITIVTACVGLIAVSGLRRGGLVSPMSVTLLMLLAIFGIRPVMMVGYDRYNFYGGNNVESGFEIAAWVGLLSVSFVLFGYFFGRLTRGAKEPELGYTTTHDRSAPEIGIAAAAAASASILLAWLLLMAATGGGFGYLVVLFEGRGAGGEAALAGVPAIVPALPVVAGLVLAYARITVQRLRRLTVQESILYWLMIVVTIVPPSALGSRRFLLPSLLAAVLGALPPSWFKLVTWRMVGLAVATFLALSIIPFVRSSGSRQGKTDLLGAMGDYFGEEGIGGTLENFFLSYDTEMFNYIAFLARRLGGTIEYGLGRGTVLEAVVSPLPAALSKGLGPRWSDEILIQAFGGACGVSYCPVPSVSGVLFYDLGLPGVIIGMTLLGILLSRFESNFLGASGNKLLILLALAAFMPQLVRGNTIAQLWIAAQIVVLLVILRWAYLLVRPPRPRASVLVSPRGVGALR